MDYSTIEIRRSPTADSRYCDPANVTKEQLHVSSLQHINDVQAGMRFLMGKLAEAGMLHDQDKLTGLDHFHSDFVGGFKEHGWWDSHRKMNRHHLNSPDGIPEDVNLVDVLEYAVDCTLAGMARSGSVYPVQLPPEVLLRAFQNTVDLIKANTVILEDTKV